MQTSLYAFVMDRFASSKLTYQQIADGSGIPRRTIEKIARREIEDPGVRSVEQLARYFQSQEQERTA